MFADIDLALAEQDIKRAEVAIARRLRGTNTPEERADLLMRRAKTRLMDARPDDALEDLETCQALQPARSQHAEIKVLFGDCYFARFELAPVGFLDRSNTDLAKQYYQQVVEQHPTYPEITWVLYQLGRIELSQNETAAAATYFERSLQAPSQPAYLHAMSYERLGFIALFEERAAQKALSYFKNANAHQPAPPDPAWLVQLSIYMSRAYLEQGQHQEALDVARRALRAIQEGASPQQRNALPEAHFAIAQVLSGMPERESEAIEFYLRFLQSSRRPQGVDVTWSQVHETIGQLSFRLGRYQQAIAAFEKALEFNPDHPWEIHLRYQIARCHYRMRTYEEALAAIQKMESADDELITDWRVYNLKGNAYFALEKYPQAAQAYQSALALAPANTEELKRLQIYLRFSQELSGE